MIRDWIHRLKHRNKDLNAEDQAYLASLNEPMDINPIALTEARLLVVDLETSGLNIDKDVIISVGAIGIDKQGMALAQTLDKTIDQNIDVTEAIIVHGITPSDMERGDSFPEVLLDLLELAHGAPIVAHHAWFEKRMLTRALREQFGLELALPFIDTAELAPALFPDADTGDNSLDHWLDHFRISVHDRHKAFADAFVTAELMLVLLDKAMANGMKTVGELVETMEQVRKLARLKQP